MNKIQYRAERVKWKLKQEQGGCDFFELLLNPMAGSYLVSDPLYFKQLAFKRGVVHYKKGFAVGQFVLDNEWNSARQAKLLSVKQWKRS